MPGMVTSIVESLKYLTPMAFDVMTFAVLRQLASPKKKLKVCGAPAQRTGSSGSRLRRPPFQAVCVVCATAGTQGPTPACPATRPQRSCKLSSSLARAPRLPQDDGVNLEEWYQWLAAFTGLLCKKHPCVGPGSEAGSAHRSCHFCCRWPAIGTVLLLVHLVQRFDVGAAGIAALPCAHSSAYPAPSHAAWPRWRPCCSKLGATPL